MKVEELRVGNLVFYEETIDDHEERQITASDIATFEVFYERYSPIPTTKEWLAKLGFEQIGQIISSNVESTIIYNKKSSNVKWNSVANTFEPEFVHDIQNKYFSDNNKEELTIK